MSHKKEIILSPAGFGVSTRPSRGFLDHGRPFSVRGGSRRAVAVGPRDRGGDHGRHHRRHVQRDPRSGRSPSGPRGRPRHCPLPTLAPGRRWAGAGKHTPGVQGAVRDEARDTTNWSACCFTSAVHSLLQLTHSVGILPRVNSLRLRIGNSVCADAGWPM